MSLQLKLIAATTLLGSLAACGSRPDAEAAAPQLPAAPVVAQADPDPDPGLLPADTINYFLSGGDLTKRQVAGQRLLAECMSASGWTYAPFPPTANEPSTRSALIQFRRQHGYGRTMQQAVQEPTGSIGDRLDLVPKADKEAYLEQWRRCSAKVDDLDRSTDPVRVLPAETIAAAFTRTAKDPRLAVALTKWRDCLAAAGFPGQTEPGLVPSTIEYVERTEPSAEFEAEVRLATADVECQAAHYWKVHAEVWAPEIELLEAEYAELGGLPFPE